MKERILILLLLATVCSMQAQNIHMALRPDDLLIDNFEGDNFWKLDIGRKCFWQFTSFYGTFVNMGG